MTASAEQEEKKKSDLLVLQEIEVGGQTLKNRVILSPMTRAR